MALVLVMSLVSTVQAWTSSDVEIEGIVINGRTVGLNQTAHIAGFAEEVVPITVLFNSNIDASDVTVSAWIGGKYDSDSTRIINLVNGSKYSEHLSLRLPKYIDVDEDYTLYIRIEAKGEGSVEKEFDLRIQRESYNLEVLDVDVSRTAQAGGILTAQIVLKNIGYEELEDVFVSAEMPELGLEKKGSFFDLTPVDDDDGCCKQDSGERTISLAIPSNALTGSYTLEVMAYNRDTEAKVTKTIFVSGKADSTEVFVPIQSKEVTVGETVNYEIILVNTGSTMAVYQITPEVDGNMFVSAIDPIVTVPAGSSRTAKVSVRAGDEEGTHSFALNIESDGELVEKVNLVANVNPEDRLSNTTVLTIVLAIIFVVLLVILVVLLLRKPEKENIEESYY
jgi:hypothetical protein